MNASVPRYVAGCVSQQKAAQTFRWSRLITEACFEKR